MSESFRDDPLFDRARKMLAKQKTELSLVHSDLLHSLKIRVRPFSVNKLSAQHLKAIKSLLPGKELWMPSFNYDYFQTGVYGLSQSLSQVGHLTEFFRTNRANWRSEMPVFSFCGTGKSPKEAFLSESEVDCFDEKSLFHVLHMQDGQIVHYGSPFPMSMTIMHYCERMSGNLLYRYDKFFEGELDHAGQKRKVKLKYHVRPLDGSVQYDWLRFEKDLIEENLITFAREGKRFIASIGARNLCDWLIVKLREDAFYLLDETSKDNVKSKLDKLGRPFLLEDFE